MTFRRAWTMRLRPGAVDDYEAAHRAVWPELLAGMKAVGIERFVIYRQETTLFAFQERTTPFSGPEAEVTDLTRRWWAKMQPLMVCHPDGRPVQNGLSEVFFL